MSGAIGLLLFVGLPALIVLLTRHMPWAMRVGPIVLCYAAGLVIGLTGLLPAQTDAIRNALTEASLALALPLLLFGVDVRAWSQMAGRALLSMLLAVVAAVTVATALYYLFTARGVSDVAQLSGMAVGMYTGGIANLGAIKLALGISDARYLMFATVDTVVGAIYLLFVLTIARTLVARVLPTAPDADDADHTDVAPPVTAGSGVAQGVIALAAAAVCVGAAVVLAPLLSFMAEAIMVIVLLTSFGIVASMLPALRRNTVAPELGMFGIYVFSFCVAASLDLAALRQMDLAVLGFVLLATTGIFALHALFCRLARVDADTFLITSVAAILSPAFVPMVARALGKPGLLMSGMATGILGFAIGNYLGIALALMLARGGAAG